MNTRFLRSLCFAIATALHVLTFVNITDCNLRAADVQSASIQSSRSIEHALPGARVGKLTFSLQSRNEDGQTQNREESFDPQTTGIIVVDPWNFHWCKTATMRV